MNGVWFAVGTLLVSTTLLAIAEKLIPLLAKPSCQYKIFIHLNNFKELTDFLALKTKPATPPV